MTDPGRPNSPEREAWCKADRLRALIRTHEANMKRTADLLQQDRQQLAEALCPFKVGDRVQVRDDIAYGQWQDAPLVVCSVNVAEGSDAVTVGVRHEREPHGQPRSFDSSHLCKLAPEPAPDAEVEAVAKGMCEAAQRATDWVDLGDYLRTIWRNHARAAIAALDAVRVERRAKAQDARVEAAAEALRRSMHGAEKPWSEIQASIREDWRRHARRILAAADAALEGGK